MDTITPLHLQGPIIDRAHLARMTGGDQELQLEVLGMVRDQAERWRGFLASDIETEDWRACVHTVKGSARGIGAWMLAEICNMAELEARSGPMAKADRLWHRDKIVSALDEVLGDIARIEHQMAIASLRAS